MRSFSKIRHIQEANQRFEKRYLTEQKYVEEQTVLGFKLLEQPDEVMDRRVQVFTKTPYAPPLNKNGDDFNIDNIVDVISVLIDGIPGLGNLISYGIDVVHSISYFIRYTFFSNSEEDKIYNFISGILNLVTAHIPVGGNVVNITSRSSIKLLLKETPIQILKVGKQLGLYNGTLIFLKKTKWKYSLLLLLAKLFGEGLEEKISEFISNINKMIDFVGTKTIIEKKVRTSLTEIRNVLTEMQEFVPLAIKLSSKLTF